MKGYCIPQCWGSDNKGPLTVGLSTGANSDQVNHDNNVLVIPEDYHNVSPSSIMYTVVKNIA